MNWKNIFKTLKKGAKDLFTAISKFIGKILQFKIAKTALWIWLLLLGGLILVREIVGTFLLNAAFILLMVGAIALMCFKQKWATKLFTFAIIFIIAYGVLTII